MYALGIDIGSTTSKCVLMDRDRQIAGKILLRAGIGTDGPRKALNGLLEKSGITMEEIGCITATGYGRLRFEMADHQVSELTCHAAGTHFMLPSVRTVIDIGGQDVKALSLDEEGRLLNFVMNDKCAAGTGRFLDVMAGILQMDVEELGKEALMADEPASISSTCTVFAESEVISQLAGGTDRRAVIAGICESVANKASSLAKRLAIKQDIAMSGGVARNAGVIRFMERNLSCRILHHEDAQYAGAVGAALLGVRRLPVN